VRAECFQRQLGRCAGACLGLESPETYNQRFDEAFTERRIKTWPFGGPIVVKEDPEADEGTAYIIDSWRITETIRYNENGIGATDPTEALFDFDTYKILAAHLLKKNVRASLMAYDPRTVTSTGEDELATIS
jgi:hypothetical protein